MGFAGRQLPIKGGERAAGAELCGDITPRRCRSDGWRFIKVLLRYEQNENGEGKRALVYERENEAVFEK